MTPSATTADRILLLPAAAARCSTAALAAALQTTTEAVRQQVHKLAEAGLCVASPKRPQASDARARPGR